LLRQGLISDDIKNEERAIKKLCGKPTHKNIVEVLRLGDLFNSPYYFIDMELCDFNLEDYIYRDLDLPIQTSTPRFVTSAPSEAEALPIWKIMMEITSGVEFIHSKDEIHRDLKPSNSTFRYVIR
jgi:serine/threonine protein kinase